MARAIFPVKQSRMNQSGASLTATQSAVAAIDIALGRNSVGNRTAGSAFPWRHQTSKTPQNALPAVDCQRRCLQEDRTGVAVDFGSSFNRDPECGCRD